MPEGTIYQFFVFPFNFLGLRQYYMHKLRNKYAFFSSSSSSSVTTSRKTRLREYFCLNEKHKVYWLVYIATDCFILAIIFCMI